MALGVEHHWAQAFAGIIKDPPELVRRARATATAWDSIPSSSVRRCTAWRRICIRSSCHPHAPVQQDQDGAAAVAASAAGEDFPAAASVAAAAAPSSNQCREQSVQKVVRPERLELPTLCSEGRCSIRLSYGRLGVFYGMWAGAGELSKCDRSQRKSAVVRLTSREKAKGAAPERVWAPSF